jgi:hypothetical protein
MASNSFLVTQDKKAIFARSTSKTAFLFLPLDDFFSPQEFFSPLGIPLRYIPRGEKNSFRAEKTIRGKK